MWDEEVGWVGRIMMTVMTRPADFPFFHYTVYHCHSTLSRFPISLPLCSPQVWPVCISIMMEVKHKHGTRAPILESEESELPDRSNRDESESRDGFILLWSCCCGRKAKAMGRFWSKAGGSEWSVHTKRREKRDREEHAAKCVQCAMEVNK